MYIFCTEARREYSSLLSHTMDLWRSGGEQQKLTCHQQHFETHFEVTTGNVCSDAQPLLEFTKQTGGMIFLQHVMRT